MDKSEKELPAEVSELPPARSNEQGETTTPNKSGVIYGVDDVPPWYLCIALGFQHYLTAFGSTISVPLILANSFCMMGDVVGISQLVSTVFFISGVSTLIQTTIGIRLPIVQGTTFALLTPTISILNLPQWECPFTLQSKGLLPNDTILPEPASPEHRQLWQARIAEIQGAIMVGSLFQVFIGFSGLMGFLLRFIGPLSITPTITLVGLSLFIEAADKAASQWWIALVTMFLITLFSQYIAGVQVPCVKYSKSKGIHWTGFSLFKLFPVLLAMLLSWLLCYILTVAGALPENANKWGYLARTDKQAQVLQDADWFRFPYPGQWGTPTVSMAGVFGMLAGIIASMIESVGDYYACARLANAPPPPHHAVNRGIGMEGIGSILAGAWGSGNGTTSFSENIGVIGITKVGSRRVVQVGGILMIILGCLGKFGALFVTMPDPVIGGMFMIMFSMITGVGLSNLQYVDLQSSRNVFILGTSIFCGISLPIWMKNNPDAIKTGNDVADQIITVLLSTGMFVGGAIGFVFDNTMPGTDEERGMVLWRQAQSGETSEDDSRMRCYDLPLIQKFLNRWKWTSYIPFCPTFRGCSFTSRCCSKRTDDNLDSVNTSTFKDNSADMAERATENTNL